MQNDKLDVKLFTLRAKAELEFGSPFIQNNQQLNVNEEKMIRTILESNLRHAITAAGAWLAAQGYMLELDQQLVGGLATVGAGFLLGLLHKIRK